MQKDQPESCERHSKLYYCFILRLCPLLFAENQSSFCLDSQSLPSKDLLLLINAPAFNQNQNQNPNSKSSIFHPSPITQPGNTKYFACPSQFSHTSIFIFICTYSYSHRTRTRTRTRTRIDFCFFAISCLEMERQTVSFCSHFTHDFIYICVRLMVHIVALPLTAWGSSKAWSKDGKGSPPLIKYIKSQLWLKFVLDIHRLEFVVYLIMGVRLFIIYC